MKTPAVRKYLFTIARKWVEFGIDGWRLDVANEIDDDDFWREFRHVVRAANPECYIVGEVWHDSRHWLKGDMWDAVMNYLFTRACIAFFPQEHDLQVLKGTTLAKPDKPGAKAFRHSIERLLELYHPDVTSVQLNLLDSHDMARFVSIASNDQTAFRLATLFQMTYPGAPSIYYGDEIGMSGGHDPLNRGAFPWHRPETWDRDLLHEVQRLIALRKSHAVFRRGTIEFLNTNDSHDEVVAYLRKHEGKHGLVLINCGPDPIDVEVVVGRGIPEETRLREAWSHEPLVIPDGRGPSLRVPGRSGRVFIDE